MLYLQGKLLGASELEARGSFPPSCLITIYDEGSSDTLNLVADREVFDQLQALDQFAEVTLALRWRRLDLAALGGSGRGKAYRLSVVGLAGGQK